MVGGKEVGREGGGLAQRGCCMVGGKEGGRRASSERLLYGRREGGREEG